MNHLLQSVENADYQYHFELNIAVAKNHLPLASLLATFTKTAYRVTMPPFGNKGKGKGKDNRQSRSRNTTPSSVLSAPLSAPLSVTTGNTAYLDISISSLVVPTNVLYDDILERHGAGPGIPDPKHLEAITNDLRTLYQLAASRETACDAGMRELSGRRKLRIEEDRELEQQNREAEEKANLKRAAEDDELDRASKAAKLKKKKDQTKARETRPLTHGAHGIARQDGGTEAPSKGMRFT